MAKNYHEFAEELGRKACALGKGARDNPYRKGTYSHQRWERGYQAAAQGETK
jgi:hypothetical protein